MGGGEAGWKEIEDEGREKRGEASPQYFDIEHPLCGCRALLSSTSQAKRATELKQSGLK